MVPLTKPRALQIDSHSHRTMAIQLEAGVLSVPQYDIKMDLGDSIIPFYGSVQ